MGSVSSSLQQCFPDVRAIKQLARERAALPVPRSAPIRVAILGAAGQICYSLLPMIASGEMFGQGQSVILQCLDLNLPQVQENMRGMEMELQDGNFPLLQEAFFTIDEALAFKGAEYAILLGSFPSRPGSDRREVIEKNTMIFRTIGHAIDTHASSDCKILVVGHPSCSNALVCSYYAPKTPKENVFGLTRLDQNRAVGQLAAQAGVPAGEVKNVVVWGSSNRGADAEHCLIKGAAIQTVLNKEKDKRWLAEEFVSSTQQRGAKIQEARKASSAMSAARAIVDHMRDLHLGTRNGEIVSMGVWSNGNEYDIKEGLYFSMPVVCTGKGRYQVVKGLQVNTKARKQIEEAEQELLADRELAEEFARKHNLKIATAAS